MAHEAQDLVVVHRVAKRHDLARVDAQVPHDLLDARRLAHAHLHDVDPLGARRREHEPVPKLALQHVGHVHRVGGRVAEDGHLQNVHLGVWHVKDAHGREQVLVDLALEAVLVVEQEAARAVEQGDVQAVEALDRLLEAPQPDVREHLAVDELACPP